MNAHTLILGFFLTYHAANAQNQLPSWEPVPLGMVLTRNFMVPKSPKQNGYHLLPEKYRLGSKAYAKEPPAWWLQMVTDAKLNEKWHPKDFPLAYTGEFKQKDGNIVLLVVQASHSFTGDGIFQPGPVVNLVARLFSERDGKVTVLTEKNCPIGSQGDFQYSRLLAGELDGRKVVFHTDGGNDFDSRKITRTHDWTLTVGETNSLTFEKGREQTKDMEQILGGTRGIHIIETKKDFDAWFAKERPNLHWMGYQGSVEHCHYFVALIGKYWEWLGFDQDYVKLPDERQVLTPLDGTKVFYAVDPALNFQKTDKAKPSESVKSN